MTNSLLTCRKPPVTTVSIRGRSSLGFVVPRHEYPGRIDLAIGLFTPSLCVVGLILLWLG